MTSSVGNRESRGEGTMVNVVNKNCCQTKPTAWRSDVWPRIKVCV